MYALIICWMDALGVTYTTSVGVGSPPTQYTLLIDTGSSNTWVGAGKAYVKTSTSKSTGQKVVSIFPCHGLSYTPFAIPLCLRHRHTLTMN